MSGDVPIVYWDACIFITWLMDETRTDYRVSTLTEWISDFDAENAKLITSVITKIEVLDIRSDQASKQRFSDVFVPPRAQMIQVTPPIAELAHDIRNYQKISGKNLSTPDAIHLATAMIYNADRFHTSDAGSGTNTMGPLSVDPANFQYPNLVVELPNRRAMPESPAAKESGWLFEDDDEADGGAND